MKYSVRILICIFSLALFTGLASLMSPSKWPLTIETHPSGAHVQVRNSEGRLEYQGTTPVTVYLRSGKGYFKQESYMVKLNFEGTEEKNVPVGCTINDWYWLNILFGGVIGMVIVDPATGAMYKLDRDNITVEWDLLSGNGKTTDPNIFEVGEIVKVPSGLGTIPGKIVEVRPQTVIVEYQLNGKAKRREIDKYMVIR